MGTHPTSPSRRHVRGDLLSTFLAGNPALFGGAGVKFKRHIPSQEEEEGKHVPFLFKVLCCYKGEHGLKRLNPCLLQARVRSFEP
ncbi:hypothetical protein JCM24511_09365 [Saitozyma sp. JCM 24511]|nr:hypothetical protein JCM24511_09365 [Saitozyma sp. JCM 24511]